MQNLNEKKFPEHLQKLVDGLSTYNKVAIQFWLGIAFLSILAVSPSEGKQKGMIDMPFGLKPFNEKEFYPFTFVIISILIIGFGSAICQAVRTRKLMQRAIDQISQDYIFAGEVHLQDVVDAMIYPAINRVAPLAQVIYGKKQFLPEAKQASKWRKVSSRVYYTLTKLVATIVLYGLPIYALTISLLRMGTTNICVLDPWGFYCHNIA